MGIHASREFWNQERPLMRINAVDLLPRGHAPPGKICKKKCNIYNSEHMHNNRPWFGIESRIKQTKK